MTDEQRLGTAAELEQMTPNERAAVIDERVITDVSKAEPALVERARAHGRELLEARGIINATQG